MDFNDPGWKAYFSHSSDQVTDHLGGFFAPNSPKIAFAGSAMPTTKTAAPIMKATILDAKYPITIGNLSGFSRLIGLNYLLACTK